MVSLVCGIETESPSIENCLEATSAIFAHVKSTSPAHRADILDAIADKLKASVKETAATLVAEADYLSRSDMEFECERAAELFKLASAQVRIGMTETLQVDVVERGQGAIGYVKREPIGAILGITAFNAPLLIPAHKMAPAIGIGAPIVIKPSPRVPRAAVELVKLALEVGWPAEAISVLNVSDSETQALIKDERLPVVSFTGGRFGWVIKEMIPRKHVHLELGGVGAVIIMGDANIRLAAKECAAGAFVRSGQSCISVQRILVEQGRYGEFVDLFGLQVKALAAEGDVPLGTMVDEGSAARVEALVQEAVDNGAQVVCGGARSGARIEPTVVRDAKPTMKVMRAEAFGPVVAIMPFANIEDAVAEVNAVGGAIQHGLYTANIDLALAVADRIHAGGVIINGPSTWRLDHMPYGGVGDSGYGREGVRYAMLEFTRPKAVVIRPTGIASRM
ncbi:aldehyde dehydrogenase family protein [Candidimonas nitroreducens]|uniref:Aldehyde dehydrogenase n=1 Tax=Candidimonas nitroreducens TaxID=683354 RepID=A0A225MQL3_9BURK|nr:aldehyde dehydrogenase family protein [Candidimonas nitroreducens]OWT63647.1 aldehyde dehydrogenase [Candidimonas nitroreducens]